MNRIVNRTILTTMLATFCFQDVERVQKGEDKLPQVLDSELWRTRPNEPKLLLFSSIHVKFPTFFLRKKEGLSLFL